MTWRTIPPVVPQIYGRGLTRAGKHRAGIENPARGLCEPARDYKQELREALKSSLPPS